MLDVILGSRTRSAILRLLLVEGGRYRLLELQRKVGTSISSVQKELARLESIGLVRSERVAGARFLVAVRTHPLAEPLRTLFDAEAHATDKQHQLQLNPAIRDKAPEIAQVCRRHGAVKVALVGSATQVDSEVSPRDVDVLVRFPAGTKGAAKRYFLMLEELERIMGMPVDVIVEDALTNPLLRDEFERTQVVLYEAA